VGETEEEKILGGDDVFLRGAQRELRKEERGEGCP
jgi:hypothetical protein